MDVVEIDGLSGGELLDHVESLAATQQRCEVEILKAAVQHACLHHRDTLDPAETGRPGRERARRIGGAGTPQVTEFAAATLAGRLGVSTISAGMLMADGLDLVHRLPQLWARVEAGRVRVYLARLVARKTRDLTPEQAAPFATVAVFDAALQQIADILADLGDTDPVDRRRVKAVLILSRPDLAAQLLAAYQARRDRSDDPPHPKGVVSTSSTDETTAVARVGATPVIDWKRLLPQVVIYAHLYAGADSEPAGPWDWSDLNVNGFRLALTASRARPSARSTSPRPRRSLVPRDRLRGDIDRPCI